MSKIKVSIIDTPVPHWHNFMPLARAEVAKFLKTQEPGKFQKDDLLGVATVALAAAKPSVAWARKAIKGALFDRVRTRDAIVNPVEMTEDEYLSTVAGLDDCLPTARAAKPKPCDIPSDNPLVEKWRKRRGVTVGPAPRRIRRRVRHPNTGKWLELLPSRIATSTGYKVSSKHNKVATAPLRCAHQDGWEPTLGGMKRAKIDDDEDRDHTPPRSAPPQRGEFDAKADYSKKHQRQRFSPGCVNRLVEYRNGLTPPESTDWLRRYMSRTYRATVWEPEAVKVPASGAGVLAADWFRRNPDIVTRPPEKARPEIETFGSHYTKHATLIAAYPDPWSHANPRYAEDAPPRFNPTEALPDNLPLRTKAWWTALEEEGPQCKAPLWQREAGSFQIGGGRLEIHEGSGDEYVIKERQVDGQTVWLCERLEKLFSPGSYFRHFWGDIIYRDALTVPIAPPLGSGSPSLAAPAICRAGARPRL